MTTSQRRVAAVAALSAVIVLSLAAIIYTEHADATATVTAWQLTHNVLAGATYNAGDVEQVQVRAGDADGNYETAGPQAFAARYATNLSEHDILRNDDLVPAADQSEVAITVVDPPPLEPGDRVDVYATVSSGTQALIGRGMVVEAVDGSALTVLVSSRDEASWVSIAAASVGLHVARTTVGSGAGEAPLSASDAIRILCGASCTGLETAPTPSP